MIYKLTISTKEDTRIIEGYEKTTVRAFLVTNTYIKSRYGDGKINLELVTRVDKNSHSSVYLNDDVWKELNK